MSGPLPQKFSKAAEIGEDAPLELQHVHSTLLLLRGIGWVSQRVLCHRHLRVHLHYSTSISPISRHAKADIHLILVVRVFYFNFCLFMWVQRCHLWSFSSAGTFQMLEKIFFSYIFLHVSVCRQMALEARGEHGLWVTWTWIVLNGTGYCCLFKAEGQCVSSPPTLRN